MRLKVTTKTIKAKSVFEDKGKIQVWVWYVDQDQPVTRDATFMEKVVFRIRTFKNRSMLSIWSLDNIMKTGKFLNLGKEQYQEWIATQNPRASFLYRVMGAWLVLKGTAIPIDWPKDYRS